MQRKAFINLMGLSGVTPLAGICLGGCSKQAAGNGIVAAPANIDFNIDLSLPANATLLNPGGYLYSNGNIIAHTLQGNYIAVSQACTHQGVTVQYIGSQSRFYCPSHGATFSETGTATGGPTNGALKQYQVSLSGQSLRIYS